MSFSNNPFFQAGQYFSGNAKMKVGDLLCELNMPPALRSHFVNGEEVAQHLPPYNRRAAFLVDRYPAAPAAWMGSKPGTSSYMVPVLAEHGLWLDFNMNQNHTHDVAIVISIQGINALTGQKTDTLRLEQYRECCPVHGTAFAEERLCSECGFVWPPQNYIATTAAPDGLLWLDGFLASDGVTRQWVFTEKESRGVAKAILGEERVHALGVAFFLSREPKPKPAYRERLRGDSGDQTGECMLSSCSSVSSMSTLSSISSMGSMESVSSLSCDAIEELGVDAGDISLSSLSCDLGEVAEPDGENSGQPEASAGPNHRKAFAEAVTPRKNFEIAAGAKIDQPIHLDPKEPSYWQDEPVGIIVINYTDEETLLEVLKGGVIEAAQSFLAAVDVPKGN